MTMPEYLLQDRKELINEVTRRLFVTLGYVNLYTDETLVGLNDALTGAEKELPQN